MNITDILITSVSSTALVSILAFLARNQISERLKQSIKHEYDLKIKDLEHRYEIELINHKANVEKEVNKFKYRFENTYPKRIDAIEYLNKKLNRICLKFFDYYESSNQMHPIGTPLEVLFNIEKEFYTLISEEITDVNLFLLDSKLYLEKSHFDTINSLINDFRDYLSDIYPILLKRNPNRRNEKECLNKFQERITEITDSLKNIVSEEDCITNV